MPVVPGPLGLLFMLKGRDGSIDHGNVRDKASWLEAQVSSRFDCTELFLGKRR